MPKGPGLRITPAAAAELGRQAAVAGTPGLMHLELIQGGCEQWTIRLRPGHLAGTPVARADGITLYAPADQLPLLAGLGLDYRGDLSGGCFLVRGGGGIRSCACGAAFSRQASVRHITQ
jgi:Fe-S cluster assembly iron-binding protein IscA